MKKLSLKIVATLALLGLFFYSVSLMKNEPDNFDPEKEYKYMLVNQDTNSGK
jgi:hypothetical protein